MNQSTTPPPAPMLSSAQYLDPFAPLTAHDLWPMPPSPHPRVHWAFTQRAGGVSGGHCAAVDLQPHGHGGTVDAGDAPLVVSASACRKSAHESSVSLSNGSDPGGLNLGLNCDDDPAHVAINRQRVAELIGQPVSWLTQVHGVAVAGSPDVYTCTQADAQISTEPGVALAVLVADCLPVLLADRQGRVIGAAHAGWRGLAAGVLENTVARMQAHAPAGDLVAWLGPSIGPTAFEVGEEVRAAFLSQRTEAEAAFSPAQAPGKWLADLPMLARQRLLAAGIGQVLGAGACTWSEPARFWSYRRNPRCGRMAGLIWLTPADEAKRCAC